MINSLFSIALFCVGTFAAHVQLGNTILTGTTSHQVEFFGGIPYAEPPIGDLQLREPVLKTTLNVSTFDATRFGPPCLQITPNVTSSEDCLTLNIFRPVNLVRRNQSLPVMVFIHGGGFFGGSASLYDGNPLVLKSIKRGTPVIYASMDYRLGPLGFPAGAEADQKGALNLGIKDMIAALEWIKENIAVFGGDPTKVTVFGESAGAMSIGILYLTSRVEKYARGAILESGGALPTFTFPASRRQNCWDSFVNAIPNCSSSSMNTFDCIRNASSNSLLQAMGVSLAEANEEFPWVPTLDGPDGLLPELPSQMFAKGLFSKIPFISGANLDEATQFTPTTVSSPVTIQNGLVSNCTNEFGSPQLNVVADQILQLYPNAPALGSPFNTGNETFGLNSQYKRAAAILGDVMFHSVRRLWSQTAARAGIKSYGYLFTGPYLDIFPPERGVPHGAELLYVFGNGNGNGLGVPFAGIPPDHKVLSDKIMDYWISFVSSLNPNDGKGTQRPSWPEYRSNNSILLELNSNNITPIPDNYRETGINFINNNAALFRH
ncbi:esterase 1 [Marasmius fiardii PR-910]|nr:esterase 1 [Marasmius fiardii PR-910]